MTFIVLGDKSNHVATIHLAQMLYIWPFITFFSAPLLIPVGLSWVSQLLDGVAGLRHQPLESPTNTPPVDTAQPSQNRSYVKSFVLVHWLDLVLTRKSYYPLCGLGALALSVAVVRYSTIIHPFTLADNRHYMFYIFRLSILRLGPFGIGIRYHIVPFYAMAYGLVWRRLYGPPSPDAQAEFANMFVDDDSPDELRHFWLDRTRYYYGSSPHIFGESTYLFINHPFPTAEMRRAREEAWLAARQSRHELDMTESSGPGTTEGEASEGDETMTSGDKVSVTVSEDDLSSAAVQSESVVTAAEDLDLSTTPENGNSTTESEGDISSDGLQNGDPLMPLVNGSIHMAVEEDDSSIALEDEDPPTTTEGTGSTTAVEAEVSLGSSITSENGNSVAESEGDVPPMPLVNGTHHVAFEDDGPRTALGDEDPPTPTEGSDSTTAVDAEVASTASPSASTALLWLLATALSLVTAPLVEPRYFILPWLFWRLLVPSWSLRRARGRDWALLLETAWFLAINAATGYVFLFRGFYWRDRTGAIADAGKVQRFMW